MRRLFDRASPVLFVAPASAPVFSPNSPEIAARAGKNNHTETGATITRTTGMEPNPSIIPGNCRKTRLSRWAVFRDTPALA
jgi:hypothetical protein